MELERMADFFAARADGYDEHMLNNVEGCREGYLKMAELIPENTRTLLDLGCGTGLELDEIFKRFPSLKVTGIDLTKEMLEMLKSKHIDKSLDLICGDYFSVPLGENAFDCVVSFETMHHFSKERKVSLYKKIYSSLRAGGCYVECDYMVETNEEESFFFFENARLRAELGIGADEFYHYDTPCSIENQINMFETSGFINIEQLFRIGGTTIIIGRKL